MRDELKAKLLLPEEGARVLCAVSGGADSMCLLSLLCDLGVYTVAAAHFEHGIRGGESLRDCAFVEDYCRAKGIACFVGHADVPRFAREEGIGLEEAARTLRYAFLEKTAAERGIPFRAVRIQSREEAQAAPTPVTTYALFHDGEYVTNEQMNEARFIKRVEGT